MKSKKKTILVAALVALSSISLAIATGAIIGKAASNDSQQNNKINYEIAPEISVTMPNGFSAAFPNAVLNNRYKIPAATAIDVYGDELTVDTKLYAYYYSETRSLIQIENNAFIPAFYGIYTVCYTATDSFGNVAVETFDITCEEKQPLTASIAQVNDEYFVKLYDEVSALYRLDQVIGMEGEEKELGPMPATSIGLLSAIGGAWIVIGVFYVRGRIKDKKQNKK